MKTRKSIIIMLSALMCFVLSFAVCAEDARIIGDVNGDGKITASDARAALRFSARLDKLSDEAVGAADVNCDGKVTASDARIILRAAAQIEAIPEKPDDETAMKSEPTTEEPTTEEPTTEEPTTEEPTTKEPASEPAADSHGEHLKELDIFLDGQYELKGTITTMDGAVIDAVLTAKGADMLLSASSNGFELDMLIDDGAVYMINPITGSAVVLDSELMLALGMDDSLSVDYLTILDTAADEDEYTETVTTEKIDDDEYTVYTFEYEESAIKAYTLGEKLTAVENIESGKVTMTIYVDSISEDFDESVLSIDSYTKMRVPKFLTDLLKDYNSDYDYGDDTDYEYRESYLDRIDVPDGQITDENKRPSIFDLFQGGIKL